MLWHYIFYLVFKNLFSVIVYLLYRDKQGMAGGSWLVLVSFFLITISWINTLHKEIRIQKKLKGLKVQTHITKWHN